MLTRFQPRARARLLPAALASSVLILWPGTSIGARTDAPARTADVALSSARLTADWNQLPTAAIDPEVFALALGAASCAVQSGTVRDVSTLTVIDYSKPSTAKRLWVFDVQSRELLYEELVAHGQGSGENFATMFSNEPETHRSSIGLFEAQESYVGRNGYSMRLNGLDEGFNDNARERAIVMHGAPYVNEDFARAHGRIGRSWGCPALSDAVAREVIDRVKGSGLVFAYYPDEEWLKSSKFLGNCST